MSSTRPGHPTPFIPEEHCECDRIEYNRSPVTSPLPPNRRVVSWDDWYDQFYYTTAEMQPSNVYKPFTYFIPMSSKYVDSSKIIMLPSGQIAYRSYTFSKGRSLPPSSSVSSSSSSASRRHSKFSSNASVAEKPLPKAAKSDLYKTRLCKNFLEKGACPYGKLCQYAHGMSELRQSPLG